MNNQVIFGNFLADDQLALDNQAISNYCLELASTNPGIDISNQGGWHSELLPLDNLNPVLLPLYKEIQDYINILHIQMGLKPGLVHTVTQLWININSYKDSNRSHRHGGATFSGVYYVKIPENSGTIEFFNPQPVLSYVIDESIIENYNFFNSQTWKVTPEEGKILFWPSWLYHHVNPNLSNDTRISIAFNTAVSIEH
jgi:uncharacterized protein (TIGR02466 family)